MTLLSFQEGPLEKMMNFNNMLLKVMRKAIEVLEEKEKIRS